MSDQKPNVWVIVRQVPSYADPYNSVETTVMGVVFSEETAQEAVKDNKDLSSIPIVSKEFKEELDISYWVGATHQASSNICVCMPDDMRVKLNWGC